MATTTDKYQGIELFGIDNEPIGTVAGLLTLEDRRQFYVVDAGGFLMFGKTRYYVPAGEGVATGSRRLEVAMTAADMEQRGWDQTPVDDE